MVFENTIDQFPVSVARDDGGPWWRPHERRWRAVRRCARGERGGADG
eukprot:COSAG01_NODE_37875_length_497_cov_3.826633_1_plen_46_part_10